MRCKLTIKDPALKYLLGKDEFDSIQDILDSIKNASLEQGYTLTYDEGFTPVSFEVTETGYRVGGKDITNFDSYLRALLKGYILDNPTLENLQELMNNFALDTEVLEDAEAVQSSLKTYSELSTETLKEEIQAAENTLGEEIEKINTDKPLTSEQNSVPKREEPYYHFTLHNVFDTRGKERKEQLVLEQEPTRKQHDNAITQLLNTVQLAQASGVEFKLRLEPDIDVNSDYLIEGISPIRSGVVGVIYQNVEGEFKPVYFIPNDLDNPTLTGQLTFDSTKGKNLTLRIPNTVQQIHYLKTDQEELHNAFLDIQELRAEALRTGTSELMDFTIFEQKPFAKYEDIGKVLGERLYDDASLSITPDGGVEVSIDQVKFNVYTRPYPNPQEIEDLLDFNSPADKDNILTYLNTLFDSSSKGSPLSGDIFFTANRDGTISLNSRIEITKEGINKLEKPVFNLKGTDRTTILGKAYINVDRGWLNGNVDKVSIIDGVLTYTNQSGLEFYSDKLFTHVRPTKIKEAGKEVNRFIFSKNVNFVPKVESKTFDKVEVVEGEIVEEIKPIPYSLREVWEKVRDSAKDKRLVNMVELLESMREESPIVSEAFDNITVIADPDTGAGFINIESDGKHTIRVNKGLEDENLLFVLYHEVIHGLTASWISQNPDSEIVGRLKELKKKIDKSKNKALSNYKGRPIEELFTMLIDEPALKALDNSGTWAEEIIAFFKEILEKLLGLNTSADILLYDFLAVARDKVNVVEKNTFTHNGEEFEDATGGLDSSNLFFYSKEEAEAEKERIKKVQKQVIEEVGLNNLVNGIESIMFRAIQAQGLFDDFLRGNIEASVLFATVQNWVNGQVRNLKPGETNKFFSAFSKDKVAATKDLFERNTKSLKIKKDKTNRTFVEISEQALEIEKVEDINEELSKAVDTYNDATGGEEHTSSKMVFEKQQVSSLEEANKQVRLLVRMLPKFEKTNRRYTTTTIEPYPDNDIKRRTEYYEFNSNGVRTWAKYKKNIFGITEQTDIVPVWNRLQSLLAGSLSYSDMKSRLEKSIPDFPEAGFLLDEINKIEVKPKTGLQFKRSFERTFKKFFVPVITVKQQTNEVKIDNINVEQTAVFGIVEGQPIFESAKNELEGNYIAFLGENEEYYDEVTDRFKIGEYIRDKGKSKFEQMILSIFRDKTDKVKDLELLINAQLDVKPKDTIRSISTFLFSNFSLKASFTKAVEEEHIHSPFLTTSMVNNAVGKKQTLFSQPSAILLDAELYNQNNLEEAQLKSPRLNNPLFKHSISRNRLWTQQGQRIKKNKIEIKSENGFSSETGKNTTTALPDGEYLLTNLTTLVNFGFVEDSRAQMATTSLGFKIGQPFVNLVTDKAGKSTTNTGFVIDTFFNYFRGELERVVTIRDKKGFGKGFDGLVLFDWMSKDIKDNLPTTLDSIPTFLSDNRQLIRTEITNFLESQVDSYNKEFSSKVNPYNRFENRTPKEVFSIDLIITPEDRLQDPWDKLGEWTVYNYLVSRIEEGILFHGDMAIFDKYFKRSNSIQSTGNSPVIDPEQIENSNLELRTLSFSNALGSPIQIQDYNGRPIYGTATIVDDVKISSTAKELKEGISTSVKDYFGSLQIPESESKPIVERFISQADKYEEVNIGDGGGFIHPDMYRLYLRHVDAWTDAQESVHNALILDFISNPEKYFPAEEVVGIKRDLTLEEKDIVDKGFKAMGNSVMPVIKLAYRGNEANFDGVANEVFDKFALFPLYPQFIGDKPLARAAFISMTRNNLGYIKYESGTKLKGPLGKSGDLKTLETSLVKGEVSAVNLGEVRYNLFLDRLFEQIQTSDHQKDKKTFGSQVRKLVMGGLKSLDGKYVDIDIKNGWIKTLYKYSDEQTDKVLTKFGAVKQGDNWNYDSLDTAKIMETLLTQLVKDESPKNTIEFVERMMNGDALGMEALMDSGKVENVLAGIIREIAVQKVGGVMAKQVSSHLFETQDSFENRRGTNDLRTYRYDKTKTKAAECKFGLIGSFVNLLNLPEVREQVNPNDNILDKLKVLNTLIKDEAFVTKYEKSLTMVGYRIPTQGYNSMEVLIVREFLPPFYGDTLVTHPEITTKSGTDYDYDKMSLFIPTINESGEYIDNYETEQDLKSEKKELQEQLSNIKDSANKGKVIVKEVLKGLKETKVNTKKRLSEFDRILEDIKNDEMFGTFTAEQQDRLIKDITDPKGDILEELRNINQQISEYYTDPEKIQNREDYYKQLDLKKQLRVVQDKLKVAENPSLRTQNRIIEDLSEIILNPLNFWRLMLPNSADYLLGKENKEKGIESGVFEKINLATGIKVESEKIGSSNYRWDSNYFQWQLVKMKDLLGVAAVWNTFYAVVQEHNLNLSEEYRNDKLLGYTKPSDYPLVDSYKDDLYNEDVFLKSEVNSQFINATVDASSDPTLGYYNYTLNNFGAAVYLSVMKGANPALVHRLFHTPAAIKFEYLNTVKSKTKAIQDLLGLQVYIINPGFKVTWNILESSISEIVKYHISKEFEEIESNYNLLGIKVKYNDLVFEILNTSKGLENLLKRISNNIPVSLNLEIVKDINLNNSLSNINEISTLQYYLTIIEEQNKMRDVMQSLNYDTSPDTTINKSISREAARRRIMDNALRAKTDIYYKEAIVDIDIYRSLLDKQSGSFPMAFETSSIIESLSDKVYPVLSDSILLRTIRKIGLEEGQFTNQDRLFKKLNQDFLMAVLQNFGTPEGDIKSFHNLLQRYVAGDRKTGLARRAKVIKKKLKEQGKQLRLLEIYAPFIGEVNPSKVFNGEKRSTPTINSRLFQGNETDSLSKDRLTEEFRELLNSSDQEIKEFGTLLAFVGMTQAGWSKSPIWYSDIIPSEFVQKFVEPALSKYLELDEQGKVKFLAMFREQFKYQNVGLLRNRDGKGRWRLPKYQFDVSKMSKKQVQRIEKLKAAETIQLSKINPTVSQQKVIDNIKGFLKSDRDLYLLEGGAGVGKTFSINYAIKDFRGKVVGATLSDEARGVLQQSMKGKETFTIASLLGLVPDDTQGETLIFRRRNEKEEQAFREKGKTDPIESANVVILDEASMVDKNTWNLLNELKPDYTKIVFMGDRTQLPPIGETISEVFSNLENKQDYSKLTEPIRFLENQPIFDLTEKVFVTNILEFEKTGKIKINPITKFEDNIRDTESVLFRSMNDTLINDIVYLFKNATSGKDVVVVADMNKTVEQLNNKIRKQLYNTNEQFIVGERIRFAAPYVVGGRVLAENNQKGKITNKQKIKYLPFEAYQYTIDMETINKEGELEIFSVDVPVLSEEGKVGYKKELDTRKQDALKTKNWEHFYELKELFGKIDYAYAMTVHKVQGSTYKNVFVYESEIYRSNSPRSALERNQMMRTATSRPTTNLILITDKVNDNSSVLPIINRQSEIFSDYEEITENVLSLQENNMQSAIFKGKMTYNYGDNKRKDVISKTTLDAIKAGERTATTRYESQGSIDYWKQAKIGDIIQFEGSSGEIVEVIVTRPLHKLVGSGKTAEQWSKLEGWNTEYFASKVKPKLNEAWQIEYQYITKDDTDNFQPCL